MLSIKEFWCIFQYFQAIISHPDVINFPMRASWVTGAVVVCIPELRVVLEFQQQRYNIQPTVYEK
jgi:hypothetical protein